MTSGARSWKLAPALATGNTVVLKPAEFTPLPASLWAKIFQDPGLPDHRIEIYTQDYYTGAPDNPTISWDVHDNQRRDWWGNPVVPFWYTEASLVLDLDGNPQPLEVRTQSSELAVTVGADGFAYTREPGEERGFKLGAQL